jgi:hypothetical protein
MKTRVNYAAAGVALIAAAGLIALSANPVDAQQALASRAGTRAAADILAGIGKGAGVAVVADSTIKERIPLLSAPTTAENFEQQIAEVVEALPEGTTWAKLYLPSSPGGRAWNGDDVAAYAVAQAKLLGVIGSAPAGTVEVLGRRLPAEKAKEVISSLDLKPVYLVTNPKARAVAPGSGVMTDLDQWKQMTDEQRQQHAQQKAAQLLSMDNTGRQGFVQQHMMIMSQMMRQMTPEQRQQLFEGTGIMIRTRGPEGETSIGP